MNTARGARLFVSGKRIALSVACALTLGACGRCASDAECADATVSTLALGPLIDQREAAGTGVVIVGDSLTDQSREAIAAELPGAVIDAVPGRTVARVVKADTALGRIAELKPRQPTWWVVALGTNDGANAVLPADAIRTDVGLLLDAIGRDQCVLWVLPSVTEPLPEERIKGAEDFAIIAADEVSRLPCNSLMHWSETLRATPGLLGPDGEHFTDAGEQRFASALATALLAADAGREG